MILQLNQIEDGMTFIKNNTSVRFRLIYYILNSPLYKTISNSSTLGNNKDKSKRKSRLLGAVVGTILLPRVGTVISAAHGTGKKTTAKDTNREIDAPATI